MVWFSFTLHMLFVKNKYADVVIKNNFSPIYVHNVKDFMIQRNIYRLSGIVPLKELLFRAGI